MPTIVVTKNPKRYVINETNHSDTICNTVTQIRYRVYALLCHSEYLKTGPPLAFGQINSDSLNRVPFIKSLNRQMLMNHDRGVEPVTMCLVCLRRSNMAKVSFVTLFWLIERIRSIVFTQAIFLNMLITLVSHFKEP